MSGTLFEMVLVVGIIGVCSSVRRYDAIVGVSTNHAVR